MARPTVTNRIIADGWTPHDIPGLALRIRASQANGGGAADLDPITWVPDEVSGTGNPARAAVGNPVYIADGTPTGKPVMRFTNDRLAGVKQLHGNITLIYAVASVTNALPISGDRAWISRNIVSPPDASLIIQNGTSVVSSAYGQPYVNGVATGVIAVPTDINVLMTTDATPSNVWASGYAIGSWGASALYMNGDYAEVGVVCTTAVSAADLVLLNAYLQAEYITV